MFYLGNTSLFKLLDDTISSLFGYVFRGTYFYHFQPCFLDLYPEMYQNWYPNGGGQNLPKSIENPLLPAGGPPRVPWGAQGHQNGAKGCQNDPGAPQNDLKYVVLGRKMNAPNGTTPCHQKSLLGF